MKLRRLSVVRALSMVVFGLGWATPSLANSTGMIGASGKADGFFCRNCHTGGIVPSVAFAGPRALEPGATGTYTFTVTSNALATQIGAGFNIAASSGTLGLVDPQTTRIELGEVTHSTPKPNDTSGNAVFSVTWKAPDVAGVYTLFGAGVSANLNDIRLGDAAARSTLEVFVGVSTPTPAASETPTPTATPSATPTHEPRACVGDCGDDGAVTVDEIITGVNIALGVAPADQCPQFDVTGDDQVTVDEILQAVNLALVGCPA